MVATSRALWCDRVKPRIELLPWLLKFDIVYTLLTKATDISASSGGNCVVELKDRYMRVIYA